jgi:hypothetical protein
MAIVNLNDYLQFTNQSELSNEEQVKMALAAAEDYANTYCNRTFGLFVDGGEGTDEIEVVEVFSGAGTRKYFTKEAPIVSVDKVEFWNGTDWEEFDSTGYTPMNTADRITFQEGHVFPTGNDNLRVTYIYGFTTVPADLKRAICLIAQSYASFAVRDSNIKKESDGEVSFEYFESSKSNVPDEALKLLAPYRRFF